MSPLVDVAAERPAPAQPLGLVPPRIVPLSETTHGPSTAQKLRTFVPFVLKHLQTLSQHLESLSEENERLRAENAALQRQLKHLQASPRLAATALPQPTCGLADLDAPTRALFEAMPDLAPFNTLFELGTRLKFEPETTREALNTLLHCRLVTQRGSLLFKNG